jgi:hypothetical protein
MIEVKYVGTVPVGRYKAVLEVVGGGDPSFSFSLQTGFDTMWGTYGLHDKRRAEIFTPPCPPGSHAFVPGNSSTDCLV